jgi:hypothetical protein
MTAKIKLVAAPGSNAVLPFQRKYWELYFDIVDFAPENLKDDGRTALIYNYTDSDLYRDVQLPLINDHLFDSGPLDASIMTDKEFVLQGAHWMWINEQWGGFDRGYNQPRPSDAPTKFFLMPMNLSRHHRDRLFADTQKYLDDSIWSYVVKGKLLPDDELTSTVDHVGTANDRLYLPQWYADTCFSLVSESIMDALGHQYGQSSLFVSEKSFKPLAYRHPFVIQGTALTLKYLRSLGFETYASQFDETYDTIADHRNRHQTVINLVDALYSEFLANGSVLQSQSAQAIAQHNYDVFWNREKVMQLFEKNIVEPITNFVESR